MSVVPTTTSQLDLVAELEVLGLCTSQRTTKVLQQVDRRWFVPPQYLTHHLAYQNVPLPIGYGQSIAAPQVHARCLDLLQRHVTPGAQVLDVGSGSGYVTACLALLAGPPGRVVGAEKVPELACQSLDAIREWLPELLEGGRLRIIAGNALSDEDLQGEGPFDAIHVGAASDEVPERLVELLKGGGRMVLPLGPRWSTQVLVVVDKDEGGACHQSAEEEVGCLPLLRPSEMEDGYNGP